VGIRNPLFPRRQFATLLLRDAAISTSGSGVQYFRHGGKRYGHILDPRTGWPVEGMLSVTVMAATAAEAEALSTAFFVAGVEKAVEYCHNHEGVGALILPPPRRGRTLEPVVCEIAEDQLFFAAPAEELKKGTGTSR
jgi:thiamine biosynthesis lipoprotein